MRRWLARLSYSCVILALVLTWQTYRTLRQEPAALPVWRVWLQFTAAAILFGIGMGGVRIRHAMLREAEDSPPDMPP